MKQIFYLIASLYLLLCSCEPELSEEVARAYASLPQAIDYNIHVRPILSDKCFSCHGPDKAEQKAGLRLDQPETAFGELPENPGKHAIVAGNLSRSEVFHRITSDDPEVVMPAPESNLELTSYEKAVLIRWMEEGAEYKDHWAFVKPEKITPPQVVDSAWANNPVDRFILKKLEENNLSPSPAANKTTLLRRLSFDLTGLPPTSEEIKDFLADSSDNAYEKQVDRLLASPHYGERMAMGWMDLARFADTHGYSLDNARDMSPWRDWVIAAFNRNMPYDQFVTWQMAGDLLPNATEEQILATAFNRLHPQNGEGGIIDEEFRVEYVIDRTNTAGQAFMALTVGCARCHDHKYDPISQKEFYEMSSFFNNVNEAGQISYDKAMPVPTLLLPTEEQERVLTFLQEKLAEEEKKRKEVIEEEENSFKQWLAQGQYARIRPAKYLPGIQAHFELEDTAFRNRIHPQQRGTMQRMGSAADAPEFREGISGNGLLLNGDTWFDCGTLGVFQRSDPFTVGVSVKLPPGLKDGVIFHKGIGAALYNFKGFHLALKDNRLELLMAHTAPDNAIIEYGPDLPRDQWIQLMVTYDGSSSASGYKVYLDGEEIETTVETDNLYKDIIFHENAILDREPGLQVGARWRGVGIPGAIVDDVMIFDRALTEVEVTMTANEEKLSVLAGKRRDELRPDELAKLRNYYLYRHSPAFQRTNKLIHQARTAYVDSAEQLQELMVMKEMEEPRPTYVLERGNYDARGEEVSPGTPESILEMPDDLPRNRVGFAQWLFHPDHPLTARVAVNRYWQQFFGKGLVKTTEDFGNQGEMPSHPKLLDWLALEFRDSGWNVKQLLKLMVMSATYRQGSRLSPGSKSAEADPENRLLARGPSMRLSGEMLRDNALAASGLLNDTIGGKSVKPYQPEGLWRVNNMEYEPDSGSKLYRRSLYTFWKRSVPHPTLATFDTPERSECTVRRQNTNTPLQALVLLNDPTFVECSRVLGEKISQAKDASTGITEVFLRLTGRYPAEKELKILLELQKEQLETFAESPQKTSGWLTSGEKPADPALDRKQLAANAVVASTIMNADATITKR